MLYAAYLPVGGSTLGVVIGGNSAKSAGSGAVALLTSSSVTVSGSGAAAGLGDAVVAELAGVTSGVTAAAAAGLVALSTTGLGPAALSSTDLACLAPCSGVPSADPPRFIPDPIGLTGDPAGAGLGPGILLPAGLTPVGPTTVGPLLPIVGSFLPPLL